MRSVEGIAGIPAGEAGKTASSDQHIYLREIDDRQRTSLSVLANLVPTGSTVLDIGTGTGALGRHLARRKACTVDGVTHNAQEAAVAADGYRRIEVADIEVSDVAALFADARYDIVVCADILEHLRQPRTVLDAAKRLLKDGGRLLLSVPNVAYAGLIAELLHGDFRYRQEGLLDASHLRFFTRRSLLQLLGDAGWQVTGLETITLELRASEFASPLTGLPIAVQRRLLDLPDALTYQFVVSAQATADACAAQNKGFDVGVPDAIADHSVAIYWHAGGGYSDQHKVVAWGKVGDEAEEFRFALPDSAGIKRLRLDPADRPGYLHLHVIRLESADGTPLWQWDGRGETLATAAQHQLALAASLPTAEGIVLLMTGDDPNLELPIPELTLTTLPPGSRIVVRLGWPMSDDYRALAGRHLGAS
jgi:methionine biosynthesis protein MetW